MPKTQWSGPTLHCILKRYQPRELFGLRTLLSTGTNDTIRKRAYFRERDSRDFDVSKLPEL